MSSCPERIASAPRAIALAALAAWLAAAPTHAQQARPEQGATRPAGAAAAFQGIGRPATAKELAAWDIDVRPDFRGLPKGSGSVAKGLDVWEAKCASCHGTFGESNEVFSPIVGGTGKGDIASGRAARLTDSSYPGRTTLMKLSNVSTLWDYINRAMPWNAPKSLNVEEVYAVTAYILNMGGIVADDFTLDERNIVDVQKRLPNRNGKTTAHAMWPGGGLGGTRRPDVTGDACMRDCAVEPRVASFLPDHARNAHGNLAEQNRLVGPQRGADTTRPPSVAGDPRAAEAVKVAAAAAPAAAAASGAAGTGTSSDGAVSLAIAQKHACTACHGLENKVVGPSFRDIAKRYADRADAADYLATKAKAGGAGVWGSIPMPPQALPDGDAKALGRWLAAGAAK